ncbi:peptidylprolyl isomerase [Roseibium sp. RKSG952]|uniref:peptidylprolyl isomerase n=1 Tax=Roseibium sp. RKSG952 TaxID=2529384 RepID=UPI0012BC7D98|nr:peptidylprolyl isomerase [Roseibium sp. RKSG952]MTH95758.1 peptidylprolyl isomerase [Roseibium sp. RKSG952]
MRITIASLALSLLCVFAIPTQSVAQGAIEVIVNDEPITSYDISQRAKLIRLTQRKSNAVSRREAEQELIDEVLQQAEAKRLGVSISQSQVDGAFGNIARGVKLSPGQLSTALRQNGVNPQTLKDRLKAQLAWQQTVRRRFQATIEISESDVIAALRKMDGAKKSTSVEYDLQQVIVVVPKKSSNSFRNQRLRESREIRSKFNSCETAGALFGQYREVVLRPVGRRLETELPGVMRESVEGVEPGRLTEPQKTERGYEMLAVCGKREIASDVAARTEIENELRAREGEQLSRRYIMDLRRSATIIQR